MTNTTRLRVEPLEDRATPAAAGELDPRFGTGGIVTPTPASTFAVLLTVAPAPDGDTFVATTDGVYRLNPDGSPDALFGGGAVVPYPSAATGTGTRSIAALPDGGV